MTELKNTRFVSLRDLIEWEIAMEIVMEKLRPAMKRFRDQIIEMLADWIVEGMEKEYWDDLTCVLYAHIINKSEGEK